MALIDRFNADSPWLNLERFSLEKKFVPVIVRANRRLHHFSVVLKHLERVLHINRTILIVSHDSLDKAVIELVNNVKFMVVRQIVNPYSSNVWLNRFPGNDSTTAQDLDRYNHARGNGKLQGIKHHFLWHMSYVWQHLLPKSVNDVLLIEEDHVPSFDFYVAAQSLLRRAPELCPTCNGVVMGHHVQGGLIGPPFGVGPLGLNVNMGMSVSRSLWRQFLDNSHSWCSFDDYNWDMSLENLRATRQLPPFFLSARFSRIVHMGICGSTHAVAHQGSCESAEAAILSALANAEKTLAPYYANITKASPADATRQKSANYPDDPFWYSGAPQMREIDHQWAIFNETKPVSARKLQGFGGFGRFDQQLCMAIAETGFSTPKVDALGLDQPATSDDLGCFRDKLTERDLGFYASIVNKHGDCLKQCRLLRLPFAGLQAGNECWCGRSFGLHGQAPPTDCNLTCPIGPAQCGGIFRNQVFAVKA